MNCDDSPFRGIHTKSLDNTVNDSAAMTNVARSQEEDVVSEWASRAVLLAVLCALAQRWAWIKHAKGHKLGHLLQQLLGLFNILFGI